MEDDHVDRPDVEVRQRMQLTGTNRSIGLIALIISVHHTCGDQNQLLLRALVLRRPGGSSEEPEPVPIPNTAVKLLSANGTSS